MVMAHMHHIHPLMCSNLVAHSCRPSFFPYSISYFTLQCNEHLINIGTLYMAFQYKHCRIFKVPCHIIDNIHGVFYVRYIEFPFTHFCVTRLVRILEMSHLIQVQVEPEH